MQDMKIQHTKMLDTMSFSNEDTYILTFSIEYGNATDGQTHRQTDGQTDRQT